jgi:transposase
MRPMMRKYKYEELPEDIPALKSIIIEQQNTIESLTKKHEEQIKALTKIIETQEETIKRQEQKIEQLTHELTVLKRRVFGRRSERQGKAQKSKSSAKNEEGKASKRQGHHHIPEHLPRKRVEYELEDPRCPCGCGQTLKKIGAEISYTLEVIPAQLYVLEHVRYKYAGCAKKDKVITADMPAPAIEKCLAGPSLLADVIIKKFDDHLPLYRQSEILERSGIAIARSTLCDWLGQCGVVLKPVVERMKMYMLKSFKIHTDDTIIPVLKPGSGKTLKGRLWIYHSEGEGQPGIAIYDYTPSRSQKGPVAFLGAYEGYIQADAYSGYNILYAEAKMVEVSCWAHARRRFYEIASDTVNQGSVAHQALDWIKQLYEIEKAAEALSDDGRCKLRQEKAIPLLDEFKAWLELKKRATLPKSNLRQAIDYTLNQWEGLKRYTEHGGLDIDNNRAERLIKPIVVGRNNWTFAGSHKGAEKAAIFYSLIETAKLNGLNPYEYIEDILSRIGNHKMKDIDQLLPWNWKPQAQSQSAIPEFLAAA